MERALASAAAERAPPSLEEGAEETGTMFSFLKNRQRKQANPCHLIRFF
jgi:hypothetical protein